MYRTKIIYVDIETGEILNIEKYELNEYDVKTLSKSTKQNGNEFTTTIVKSAKKSRQQKIQWS